MAGLMQEMGQAEIEPATEELPADCREDRLEQVGDSWLALLLLADGIVVNTTTGHAFVVLKSCAFGALLWPCQRLATATAVCFAPSTEEQVRYIWAAVYDTTEWQCIPTKVLPPHVSRLEFGRDASVSAGIRAIQVDEAQTPEVVVALSGFAALNATHLDRSATRIGVFAGKLKKDWPKLSLERLEAMIRFLVPNIRDDIMCDILKSRAGLGGKGPRLSVLMSNENLDHSTTCLDHNDHEDAKEYKKGVFKAKRTVQAASADFLVARKYITPELHTDLMTKLGLSAVEGAPKASSERRRAPPSKEVWSWTESALKKLIPQVRGCTIQQVTNDHNRCWTVRYPSVRPGSHTRSFGTGCSSQAAARQVFLWVWRTHLAVNPQASCPYDLDALAALPMPRAEGAH